MDLAAIATIIGAIANIITIAAPIVIKAEQNAEPFAKIIYGLMTGNNLTDADVDLALAQANALSAEIQGAEFIPPAQPDDV
jgi:hypothetical protein